MPKMQTANCTVAIGGDAGGTTVPKYGVTASEIAVLIAIHGNGSVFDVEPAGEVERSNKDEIERLKLTYGRAKVESENGDIPVVASLFPGAAARCFLTLDELEIDETFYKPTAYKSARDPLDHDGDGRKGGSLPKSKRENKAAAPEPEEDTASDMTDAPAETDEVFG